MNKKIEQKPRNLKKNEAKQVIKGFIDIVKTIKINNKPFAVNVTTKAIITNPEISIEEIQDTLKIEEDTKLDFLRQLYIHTCPKIIKNLFPDENILNMPTISFEENGNSIQLHY
jgi:hypothetical protein